MWDDTEVRVAENEAEKPSQYGTHFQRKSETATYGRIAESANTWLAPHMVSSWPCKLNENPPDRDSLIENQLR